MKIIVLFLLFHLGLFAQKTSERKNRATFETYQVLKEDKKIKHGAYTKFYPYPKWKKKEIVGQYHENNKSGEWEYIDYSGRVYMKGSFENDKKEGLWSLYYWNDKKPSSQGNYKKDKKIGVWKYYNKHGIIIHEFDHKNNKLLYYTKNELATDKQSNDLNMTDNSKGMVLGGEVGFKAFLAREFKYPKEAQWNEVSGRIWVSFQVDENFNKKNLNVDDNPGYGLAEEAKRLIKEGPLWIPSKVNGKYVDTKYSVPITFSIK